MYPAFRATSNAWDADYCYRCVRCLFISLSVTQLNSCSFAVRGHSLQPLPNHLGLLFCISVNTISLNLLVFVTVWCLLVWALKTTSRLNLVHEMWTTATDDPVAWASVCHAGELYKNGWTDRRRAWVGDSWRVDPRNIVLDGGPHPSHPRRGGSGAM